MVSIGSRWSLALALLAPLFEELFFRGVALRSITRRFNANIGIVATGLIFGAAHFQGIQTPALVAFGWLLAWRATKTGRLGETILTHATFNGITLLGLALS